MRRGKKADAVFALILRAYPFKAGKDIILMLGRCRLFQKNSLRLIKDLAYKLFSVGEDCSFGAKLLPCALTLEPQAHLVFYFRLLPCKGNGFLIGQSFEISVRLTLG